jgi:hypothetical protein
VFKKRERKMSDSVYSYIHFRHDFCLRENFVAHDLSDDGFLFLFIYFFQLNLVEESRRRSGRRERKKKFS